MAETIVDLGIDWSKIETLRDLKTGLIVAQRDAERPACVSTETVETRNEKEYKLVKEF